MLNFPNRSRVFDPTRRAVHFWGHDSAMEWSFFVTEEALKRLQPNMERNEASLLLAFDAHRAAIHAAASLRRRTFDAGMFFRSPVRPSAVGPGFPVQTLPR